MKEEGRLSGFEFENSPKNRLNIAEFLSASK